MNTFQFAWLNLSTLVFRNAETGDLYEVALPPHHQTAGSKESGQVSFPGVASRSGTICYTRLGKSDINEDRMRRWLSEFTKLPVSEIQLVLHQLP